MIFLTVGTQFPFDRLVRAVDDLAGRGSIGQEVFGQIGEGGYQPVHFNSVPRLDKVQFDRCLQSASALIGHAGTGTVTLALDRQKPLLVMPRLQRYGEVVNDHQLAFARRFASLGLILMALDSTELAARVQCLMAFSPGVRRVDPTAVSERVASFLLSGRSSEICPGTRAQMT